MEKIYIASPFFNKWDNLVRLKMIKRTQQEFKNTKLFRPNLTPWSLVYNVIHSKFFAKRIYLENVKELNKSTILVYPEYTSDLGTLFEVGVALARGIKVFKYNFFTNQLEEVKDKDNYVDKICSLALKTEDLVLDCSKPVMAVTMGILIGSNKAGFEYSLPSSWADNIMFKFSGINRRVKDGERINNTVL